MVRSASFTRIVRIATNSDTAVKKQLIFQLGGLDVVEMGQIKVFVQKVGLKQDFLADTNMDYLTSEWPGTPNFKVDANFDVFPQKYG